MTPAQESYAYDSSVNYRLRAGQESIMDRVQCKKLDSDFVDSESDMTLFRGVSGEKTVRLIDAGYMSASIDQSSCDYFMDSENPVLMIITVKKGQSICPIESPLGESEILLPRNTRLLVTRKERVGAVLTLYCNIRD